MRRKNLGTAFQVQHDYDQIVANYDMVRFGIVAEFLTVRMSRILGVA